MFSKKMSYSRGCSLCSSLKSFLRLRFKFLIFTYATSIEGVIRKIQDDFEYLFILFKTYMDCYLISLLKDLLADNEA